MNKALSIIALVLASNIAIAAPTVVNITLTENGVTTNHSIALNGLQSAAFKDIDRSEIVTGFKESGNEEKLLKQTLTSGLEIELERLNEVENNFLVSYSYLGEPIVEKNTMGNTEVTSVIGQLKSKNQLKVVLPKGVETCVAAFEGKVSSYKLCMTAA